MSHILARQIKKTEKHIREYRSIVPKNALYFEELALQTMRNIVAGKYNDESQEDIEGLIGSVTRSTQRNIWRNILWYGVSIPKNSIIKIFVVVDDFNLVYKGLMRLKRRAPAKNQGNYYFSGVV